jgi:hypothetical protein
MNIEYIYSMFMSEKNKKKLIEKRKKLFRELIKVGPFIEASLGKAKRICGSPNCSCKKDPEKKHLAYFFTWKENKKTKTLYVPVAMWKDAELWYNNYKNFKKLSKEISDIQKELLKLR